MKKEEILEDEHSIQRILTICVLCEEIYNFTNDTSVIEGFSRLRDNYKWFELPLGWQISKRCLLYGVRFVIVEFSKSLVLIVCGSENDVDWKVNFRFCRLKLGEEEVHQGFWEARNEIPLDAIAFVAEKKQKELIIGGHSKGGAIAQLCIFDLLKRQKISRDQCRCYTFGSPLVGDGRFQEQCDSFRECLVHFVIERDPVPLALSFVSNSYAPAGTFFELPASNSSLELSSRRLSFLDVFKRPLTYIEFMKRPTGIDLSLHAMSAYRQRLLVLLLSPREKLVSPQEILVTNENGFPSILPRTDTQMMIIPKPQITEVKGKFIDERNPSKAIIDCLQLELYGEHLLSTVHINLTYQTAPVESSSRFSLFNFSSKTSDRIAKDNLNGALSETHLLSFTIVCTSLTVTDSLVIALFEVPEAQPMMSSRVTITLQNRLHDDPVAATHHGVVPFRRVLLVGQTGAGKTLLREALRDCERNLKPHSQPRARAKISPTEHTEENCLTDGKFITYQEWEGFVTFSDGELTRIKRMIEKEVPLSIIAVINACHVILQDRGQVPFLLQLFRLFKSKELQHLQILYVVTNLDAFHPQDRQNDQKELILRLIREMDLSATEYKDMPGTTVDPVNGGGSGNGGSLVFFVNSDPIYVRPKGSREPILVSEVHGVDAVYRAIHAHLETTRRRVFGVDDSATHKLLAILELLWSLFRLQPRELSWYSWFGGAATGAILAAATVMFLRGAFGGSGR